MYLHVAVALQTYLIHTGSEMLPYQMNQIMMVEQVILHELWCTKKMDPPFNSYLFNNVSLWRKAFFAPVNPMTAVTLSNGLQNLAHFLRAQFHPVESLNAKLG